MKKTNKAQKRFATINMLISFAKKAAQAEPQSDEVRDIAGAVITCATEAICKASKNPRYTHGAGENYTVEVIGFTDSSVGQYAKEQELDRIPVLFVSVRSSIGKVTTSVSFGENLYSSEAIHAFLRTLDDNSSGKAKIPVKMNMGRIL